MLPTEEEPGGQGDFARFSRADFQLMRQAANRGWSVPDWLRLQALFDIARTFADPEASRREKQSATALLIAADRSDQRDDKLSLDRAKHDHATKPPEQPTDDFEIDLGPKDQTQQSDTPAT